MKKQGGFTLIELVVVIVILGILAVTAAPRFLNLQSDARESSLQGLKGAMAGAAGIVYGRSAINGTETTSQTVAQNADGIATTFGYPAAASDGIGNAVEGLSDNVDWIVVNNPASAATPSISYSFSGSAADTGCLVNYATNASAAAPTISVSNTGC
ncbi:type II secretion system protein [Vibrio amylolyticus]|uniref:type II secretion system protein n=1 Tax=Vibrio amylolyticus TaxID=2847292 RepID=UPI0035539C01